jgi:osmoprotectant transport system substrate-binding protein
VVVGLALFLGAACGASVSPEPVGATEAIRVGAFDFAESELLAEIYAQSLERHGLPVERLGRIGSREIVEPALELGLVDVVPEYAGTMLAFVTLGDNEPTADPDRTAAELEIALASRGVSVLEPSAAQNRNAVVVLRDFADAHEIRAVSDLGSIAQQLAFGGPAECPERFFCLVGLRERYGLEFGSFVPMADAGVVAQGLFTEVIDVGLLFSTDPILVDDRLIELEDDGALQPAENVLPAVRREALSIWGSALAEALDSVSSRLDTGSLARLNSALQQSGETAATIATDWLGE